MLLVPADTEPPPKSWSYPRQGRAKFSAPEMTVIGLCGLRGAGKSAIAEELVSKHGFKHLHILPAPCDADETDGLVTPPMEDLTIKSDNGSLPTPSFLSSAITIECKSLEEALDHVTSNWKQDFVITCLRKRSEFELFLGRPFFMIVAVLAPVHVRYSRCRQRQATLTLEQLVSQDDHDTYVNELVHILPSARLTISNGSSVERLRDLVRSLELDERWTRPTWDAYFMRMAELAATRSNCMKRSVGCIIVKDKRVVATGYNGTAKGLINCCDGGCPRCNKNSRCGEGLETCLCLHAEDNALLEAGRVRCDGATLYCTHAPCLGCSIKLIQCGIGRIVYAKEYSIAHDATHLLRQAGVTLDKFLHDLPTSIDTTEYNAPV